MKNSDKNTQLEGILEETDLSRLRKKIIKKKLSPVEMTKFSNILKKLKEKLDYEYPSESKHPHKSAEDIHYLIKLSQSKNDIIEAIESLGKIGYKIYNLSTAECNTISKVAATDKTKFLNAYNEVKYILGYKGVNGSHKQIDNLQIYNLIELSKTDGDIRDTIEVLAESGYQINKSFSHRNLNTIKEVNECKTEYLNIFRKLKNKLKYKGVNKSHRDVEYLIKLSTSKDNIMKAIDALAESGYYMDSTSNSKSGFIRIEEISKNTNHYLAILKKLNAKLDYQGTKGSLEEVDTLIELSKIENAIEAIDTLVESGYNLKDDHLPHPFVAKIKEISELSNYKNMFRKLEDRLGYKGVGNSYEQIVYLIEMCKIDDSFEAIDALAESKYSLNDDRLISKEDIRNIKNIAKADISKFLEITKKIRNRPNYKLESKNINSLINLSQHKDIYEYIGFIIEEDYNINNILNLPHNKIRIFGKAAKKLHENRLNNLIHICPYRKTADGFIKYFSKIEDIEEKKVLIRSIFNCPHENKDIIDWLDANEYMLLREVGLEP